MKYCFGLHLVRWVSREVTEAVGWAVRGGYYGRSGVTDSVSGGQ